MAPRHIKDSTENPGKGGSRSKRINVDKNSDEYRRLRERNNLAVKRSRTKSKQRASETQEKVSQLKAENEMLEEKIKILNKELSFLKDLFLAHASSSGARNLENMDLSFLNEDSSSDPRDLKIEPGVSSKGTT